MIEKVQGNYLFPLTDGEQRTVADVLARLREIDWPPGFADHSNSAQTKTLSETEKNLLPQLSLVRMVPPGTLPTMDPQAEVRYNEWKQQPFDHDWALDDAVGDGTQKVSNEADTAPFVDAVLAMVRTLDKSAPLFSEGENISVHRQMHIGHSSADHVMYLARPPDDQVLCAIANVESKTLKALEKGWSQLETLVGQPWDNYSDISDNAGARMSIQARAFPCRCPCMIPLNITSQVFTQSHLYWVKNSVLLSPQMFFYSELASLPPHKNEPATRNQVPAFQTAILVDGVPAENVLYLEGPYHRQNAAPDNATLQATRAPKSLAMQRGTTGDIVDYLAKCAFVSVEVLCSISR